MSEGKTVRVYLRRKPFVDVKNLTEFKNILSKNVRVVVDFHAKWCGPCKMMSPVFNQLAEEYVLIKTCKVDVDDCEDIAYTYKVNSIPTFIFFLNGVEVKRFTGADKKKLQYEFSHF